MIIFWRVAVAMMLSWIGSSGLAGDKRIVKPIECDYSVADIQFERSLNSILGAPLVAGNRITTLMNGDEIFSAMLKAIRSAQKTITFENYIWSSGTVSDQFVAALVERAEAGVRVHCIADGIGSSDLKRRDVRKLKNAGVEFVFYNHPHWWRLWTRFNHRTHRKLLIVDGNVGFTGGVCINDEWAGNAEHPKWRETHFRIEGPAVGDLQGVFMNNWLQITRQILAGPDYFPVGTNSGSMRVHCFKSGPHDGAEAARLVYLMSIAAAKKNIRLSQAYFVPDDLSTATFLAARQRGVEISIVVPGEIDNKVVKRASRSRWLRLMEAGVKIYEFQPTLYHCKVMVVDDLWVTAGSVNFDNRSFRINDEANFNVLDADFAKEQVAVFEKDLDQSRLLTVADLKRRPWHTKVLDYFAGKFRSQL